MSLCLELSTLHGAGALASTQIQPTKIPIGASSTLNLKAKGFIEGYLWSMRSRVKDGAGNYPLPNSHYFSKVDQYIRNHPDSGNKPVAVILTRFRAQQTSK